MSFNLAEQEIQIQTHSKQYSSYFVLKTTTADNISMHVHMRTIRGKNTMCECTLF